VALLGAFAGGAPAPPKPVSEHVDTLVVGAGPAGLAVAACLAHAGRSAVLLERGAGAGASWVQRYDALRLHTPRRTAALPHLPLSGGPSGYPDRAELAAYLARYATHFALDVRPGCEARVARRDVDGGWRVESTTGSWSCRHLVLAAGHHRLPVEPPLPGRDRFAGEVLHSSQYRHGARFRGRRALVVGGGNSAADLAADLVAHGAHTLLAVRGPLQLVPREVLGCNWQRLNRWLPGVAVSIGARAGRPGRAVAEGIAAAFWARVQEARFGDLRELGLPLRNRAQIVAGWRARQPPLTGEHLADLLRLGAVTLRPALVDLDERGAHFANGEHEPVDLVALATGFRHGLEELLPEEDAAAWSTADGMPREGPQPALPGLYLCGYQPELFRIAASARRIAAAIARGDREDARTARR
jgi:cation diffusion facilitator CzcD-associated flavoprotein CzcO